MTSEIRSLLARAQAAEARGDVRDAVEQLQQAARFYRSRRMERRAAQMDRHIDRLEGRPVDDPLDAIRDPGSDLFDEDEPSLAHVIDDTPFVPSAPTPQPEDDGLGFGDELLESPLPERAAGRELSPFDRGPQAADPAVEAWCSFCCRPKAEVGALVAGPAGAYICASCVGLSGKVLSVEVAALPVRPTRPLPAPPVRHALFPAQERLRAVWDRRQPKLALVVGPEGAGKSALLSTFGEPVARPVTRLDGDTVLVDLASPLTADEEHALQAWLDGHPGRRAVIAARGDAPAPVLVLQGEQGDEPVYDTDSLHRSVSGHLSPQLLSRIDSVLPLPPPDRESLRHLAQSLLAARGIELPAQALESIVALAERSGRGARELAALIARIPSGRYGKP